MRSSAPVSLALLLVLLTACQARAAAPPRLTVTCEAPQGVDMSYGSGLLGLQEGRVETASVAYPDLQPTFVAEDDVRRIIIFIVNSRSSPKTNWDESEQAPSDITLLVKATDMPIDH